MYVVVQIMVEAPDEEFNTDTDVKSALGIDMWQHVARVKLDGVFDRYQDGDGNQFGIMRLDD